MNRWILCYLCCCLYLAAGFNVCGTDSQAETLRIVLTDLNRKISVPSNVKTLELERGRHVYVYGKVEDLKEDKFIVLGVSPNNWWHRVADGSCPSQLSAAAFSCVPEGKQEDEAAIQRPLHVEVLPACSNTRRNVRKAAGRIRDLGKAAGRICDFPTMRVSGIHFKQLKRFYRGRESCPPHRDLRLFYITDLQVQLKK